MDYLIDVRTADEFAGGHYEGAINLDVNAMSQGALPDVPRDASIGVYCRSGMRAAAAEQMLRHAGFSNVTNLGGYNGTAHP